MKITIIGAGIAGLSVAIALRKYRPEIELEIFEASPELKPVGAGLALAANAIMAFEQIGIKDPVLAVSKVLEHFEILDGTGRVLTKSDNLAINRQLHTVSNFSVHRADLQAVLFSQISGLPVHLNKKVQDFRQEEGAVQIHFTDNTYIRTDFVIAADGIHSIFRQRLLPHSRIRYAGYTCWRGVTGPEAAALQPAGASETWAPAKRFGIVPLTHGRVYWFACVNAARQQDKRLASFGKTDLLDTFGDLHQPVAELIAMTDPGQILWNDIIDFAPVKQFAFRRVLLLGDAAHATTPNMGQGACQAIEGAAILGKTMAAVTDPEAAFRTFEQKRLKRTALIVNRSRQLGRLGQLANPLAVRLRNMAFRMMPDAMSERQVRTLLNVEF
jgi:2-polyprenyl-6-methoxyphenol hydroxylase-like FAD-dependent oxidoreductase